MADCLVEVTYVVGGREVSHKVNRMSKGTTRHCRGHVQLPPPPPVVIVTITIVTPVTTVTTMARATSSHCRKSRLVTGCGFDIF